MASSALTRNIVGIEAFLPQSNQKSQCGARFNGLKVCPAIRKKTYGCLRAAVPHSLQISCAAEPATLEAVQSVIAKQLAVELDTVHPGAKFADLGADSLDTVEIMMALEEQFSITLDEEGAEKIVTVQDAADMIEIVKNAQ
ncbi:unnamed protein product [Sphagnum balticum]